MNTAVFVTNYNIEAMKGFLKRLAERQTETQDALLIVAGYYIEDAELVELRDSIAHRFTFNEVVKVQSGASLSNDRQIATMVATFLMGRYTRHTGPWLFIDEGTEEIVMDEPMSVLEKAHRENATQNTGRASTLGGGRVPVGPVVIESPIKRLKTLRSVSNESWRNRARWVFNTQSWHQVVPERYPFRIGTIEGEASSSAGQPTTAPPRPVAPPKPTEGNAAVGNQQPGKSLPVATPKAESSDPPKGAAHGGAQTVDTSAFPAVNDANDVEGMMREMSEREGISPEEALKKLQSDSPEPKPGEPGFQPTEEQSDRDVPETTPHPASMDVVDDTPPVESPQKPKEPRKLPFVQIAPEHYEEQSRETLYDQLAHRSDKKPHPKTGKPKLIEKLKILDGAEAKRRLDRAAV